MVLEYNLIGEYDVSLDSKGRFRIPGALLKKLGDRDELEFVVNQGFDKCLTMYPRPVWNEVKKEVDELSDLSPRHKTFKRIFYRGANEVTPDSADRILLPKRLQAYAEGEKSLILCARNDRIEIWTEAAYDELLQEALEDPAALAEELFGDSKGKKVED
ncbi:division/cell wall cluster transcriptional repressor MraZ [Neolewinella aurantiaca]|uniref:Transcriptional regulator MraZ n=2 Tax=Neolewinella aurantiaca TaxID=2602767 RepID=A0A5C7FIU8_9BACT|nr:division/cell wall cluster transcriptional repressor MraZ [Neolewinella aurantiaca]